MGGNSPAQIAVSVYCAFKCSHTIVFNHFFLFAAVRVARCILFKIISMQYVQLWYNIYYIRVYMMYICRGRSKCSRASVSVKFIIKLNRSAQFYGPIYSFNFIGATARSNNFYYFFILFRFVFFFLYIFTSIKIFCILAILRNSQFEFFLYRFEHGSKLCVSALKNQYTVLSFYFYFAFV